MDRMIPWIFFICILFLVRGFDGEDETGDDGMYCASLNNNVSAQREKGELVVHYGVETNGTSAGNATVKCKPSSDFCFTLFTIDSKDKNKVLILMQGCWDHSERSDCPSFDCVASTALMNRAIQNYTRFCCCSGNMCNGNVSDIVNLTIVHQRTTTTVTEYVDENYGLRTIVISLTSVGAFAVIVLLVFLLVRCFLKSSDPSDVESSMFLVQPVPSSIAGQLDVDDLKIDRMIHRGRYGEVYKAILNDADVAVKSLFPNHRQFYYNERDIYTQPHMQTENVARFCGYHEKPAGPDGPAQYMIITTYVENGTLTNYLKNNTTDWSTLCRVWHSIASGLAHLHTEIVVADKIKPTIAHRDFNSRNILVKPDLTCCICDFGLAMKIMTTRLNDANSVDPDEHLSLADVGTLRYMAPEVLEGSVNLYDCKTSLTQVDVYSLGLVFWEIATRCHDLYQGLPTPDYQLPFEVEVGIHPSFEDMQVLVSRNKTRPTFPEIWKDSNLVMRSLKDTIEECWDQDPEARVSAVCVEERSRELMIMWDTWHRCVTPTVNFGRLKDLEDKALVQHNITVSRSCESTSNSVVAPGDASSQHLESEPTTTNSAADQNPSNQRDPLSYSGEESDSTVTVETTMTVSPSDTRESTSSAGKPDCNLIYAKTNLQRQQQPHQGQNPTVERNTHKNSDEELAIEGNRLVDRRSTGQPPPPPTHYQNHHHQQQNGNIANGSLLLMDALMGNLDNDILDFENRNLRQATTTVVTPTTTEDHQQNGRQQQPNQPWPARAQHRISFVPNIVEAPNEEMLSEPTIIRPKKQNIPSNGGVDYSVAKATPTSGSEKKASSKLGNLRKKLMGGGGVGGGGGRARFPFVWRLKGSGGGGQPADRRDAADGDVRSPVPSEVCLVNGGGVVVRPTSLHLNGVKTSASAPTNERAQRLERVLDRNASHGKRMNTVPESGGGGGETDRPRLTANAAPPQRAAGGGEIIPETSGDSSGSSSETNRVVVVQTVPANQNDVKVVNMVSLVNNNAAADTSESSADNMGYEVSCSPNEKAETCIV